jgi:hypothetical protein
MRGSGIDSGVKLHPLSALSTVQEATTENLHPIEHQREKSAHVKMVKPLTNKN